GRFEFVVLAQSREKAAVAEGSVRVSVEELSGVSFQVLDFLIGEKLAAFQLFWTFERRRRIMRHTPDRSTWPSAPRGGVHASARAFASAFPDCAATGMTTNATAIATTKAPRILTLR